MKSRFEAWLARDRVGRAMRELRDAVELVLLPGVSVLLPWPWCFRLFRWLCQHTGVYRAEALAAMGQAQRFGVVQDPAAWLWQRQLVTLVDHADLYLSRFRGRRWLARYLERDGHWPPAGQAGVLLTFHWGAGMWALRDAALAGLHPHMLLAVGHDAGSRVANWYARTRARQVQRCCGRPVVAVDATVGPGLSPGRHRVKPGALQKVMDEQEQLLAVVDVPADQIGRSMPVSLNGWPARAPLGLFERCAREAVPLTVYWTDVCMQTGRRRLVMRSWAPGKDAPGLVEDTFAELATLLREQPSKWHFWALADRYFVAACSGGVDPCGT